MVEIDGEVYLIATRAAKYIGISRAQFYNNVRGRVRGYRIGARRQRHYRCSDLDQFRVVEEVV